MVSVVARSPGHQIVCIARLEIGDVVIFMTCCVVMEVQPRHSKVVFANVVREFSLEFLEWDIRGKGSGESFQKTWKDPPGPGRDADFIEACYPCALETG